MTSDNFNPTRLKVARWRRKQTCRSLSSRTGISAKALSRFENDACIDVPTEYETRLIADALKYPEEFFRQEDVESVDTQTVSFLPFKIPFDSCYLSKSIVRMLNKNKCAILFF